MHFRICYTMNAEDIFRSSIGCEIMLMIKARVRLIFSRYNRWRLCTLIFHDMTCEYNAETDNIIVQQLINIVNEYSLGVFIISGDTNGCDLLALYHCKELAM